MEHQIIFGRKFYKDKVKGYWISTDYPRIRAHLSTGRIKTYFFRDGKKWHRQHAKIFNFGNWEKHPQECEVCKITYYTKKRSKNRFCSNNCKSQWRRLSGIDGIQAECLFCKKSFSRNKYGKQKYCSCACANKRNQKT